MEGIIIEKQSADENKNGREDLSASFELNDVIYILRRKIL
jgi:hypothetical protein